MNPGLETQQQWGLSSRYEIEGLYQSVLCTSQVNLPFLMNTELDSNKYFGKAHMASSFNNVATSPDWGK